jgi:hypothetical protein
MHDGETVDTTVSTPRPHDWIVGIGTPGFREIHARSTAPFVVHLPQ